MNATETYEIVQVSGGKFHRLEQTTHERMQWFRPMLTACHVTITPLNVFSTEADALSYTGRNRQHLCSKCFPKCANSLLTNPATSRYPRKTQ